MRITVETAGARETLQRHSDAHRKEYKLQLTGWQEKMKEYGLQLQEWATAGGKEADRPNQPQKPQQFDKEYKRLLKMLQLHTKADLMIEDSEFNQIFLDRFQWRSAFLSNSALYGTASLQSSDEEDDDDPWR